MSVLVSRVTAEPILMNFDNDNKTSKMNIDYLLFGTKIKLGRNEGFSTFGENFNRFVQKWCREHISVA
jgi:hypothetical protein